MYIRKKNRISIVGLLSVFLTSQAGSVTLDVRPKDTANFVDTTSTNKSLDVAVLSTSTADGDSENFDATQIDPATVRFGSGLASPDANYLPTAVQDVDGDGDDDLNLVFAIPQTGIVCEDTTVDLTGQLYAGSPINGSDSVTTPDCPGCHGEEEIDRDADDEAFFVAEDAILQVEDPAQAGFTGLDSDVANGTLNLAPDGSFSYTPNPNFFGLDNFSYRDSLNNLITVSISVESLNDVPVASADTFSIASGVVITRSAPGVMGNDSDGDGDPLTATLISSPTHGQLVFGNDGSFSYTPNAEFAGQDSFSYNLSDGIATSDTATVAITLPNILLVLVDDMGQGDAPIYNPGSAIPMPNLTALANAGIRFDNAHSTASACSPTRYSLLTGNYPYRGRKPNGVWKTQDPETMIIPGQQTLGHTLQSANYHTAFIGKLHNGGAFWNLAGTDYATTTASIDFTRSFDRGPTQFGFDYSFLLPGGVGTGPYAYFENDRLVRYDSATAQFMPFTTTAEVSTRLVSVSNNQPFNGGTIGSGGYAMDNYDSRKAGPILTNRALAFIDQHLNDNNEQGINRPFFLYMATTEPHTPWTPPPVFNAANPMNIGAGMPGTAIANATPISKRTDVVYETDVILGTLIAKLDDEGLLNNTLIIFTSDNGPNSQNTQPGYSGIGERIETGPAGDQHINAQGIDNGAPLRGYKLQIYEGGHKAPLVMRWGDGTDEGSIIQPGRTTLQMIGSQDLMATIADLTGVQLPTDQGNDSFSFSRVLLKTSWRNMRDHMIIQGNPIVQEYDLSGPLLFGQALYAYDYYGDLWKLIVDSDYLLLNSEFAALYNLTSDPGETNNRLNDPTAAAQLAAMSEEFLSLINLSRTAD